MTIRPRIPRVPSGHPFMVDNIRQHIRTTMSFTTSATPRTRTRRRTSVVHPPPVIHPDGSRRPEGAGAAAYVRFPGPRQPSLIAKLRLGDRSLYTSTEAEYWAAMLGLHIIDSMLSMGYPGRVFYLAADYLGVVLCLQMTSVPPSYAHMPSMVQNYVKRLMSLYPGVQILPIHTPSHSGIEGNEKADRAARDAARGETSVNICENQ
ncbi:hypothetical protein BC629DRAFT_1435225 [Irpex lacteus]|nr:hypothetical protein BC629DRAFT_1435225 [Irpex lacteus]